MSDGGPAFPCVASTDAPDGGPALRVAIVSDGRPVQGGPAYRLVPVSDGRPTQGNVPVPFAVVTGAQAQQTIAGPAIPVVVVSGTLGGSPPVNTVLPVISGTTELAATLSTTDGTWTNSPTSYTYAWKRNGVAVGGATSNTYVLVSADLGTTITVTVTASNAAGSASATSAGTAIPNWLLLDHFTTSQAAPLTSPRTCEPGPGTLITADTANRLSISGSQLVAVAGASDSQATDNTTRSGAGKAQVATFINMLTSGRGASFGYNPNTTVNNLQGDACIRMNAGTFELREASAVIDFAGSIAGGSDVTYCFVRRASVGVFYFLRSPGHYGGNWVLFWVGQRLSTGSERTSIYFPSTAAAAVDDLKEVDFPAPWTTAFGGADSYSASISSGVTATPLDADGLIECKWTPAAGETFELMVRRTDDNNCLILRAVQATNALSLIRKNAGVETTIGSGSGTLTAGVERRFAVRSVGSNVRAYWDTSSQFANVTETFNQTTKGIKAQGFATGRDLAAWGYAQPGIAAYF